MKTEKTEKAKIIPAAWELPITFHRRLGREGGRQRAMVHEGHLLLILHEVPEPGIPERHAILFWRHPEGRWRASDGRSTVEELLQRYAAEIDQLEEKLQDAEHVKPLFEILRATNPVRRALHNLQLALQQAREQMEDREVITWRDRAYDLSRAADLLADDTKHSMEYELAKIEEEQARVAHRMAQSGHQLNLLAALFFPLTAIASIFGMNLSSGLENGEQWMFWATLIGSLLVGLVLRAQVNRK